MYVVNALVLERLTDLSCIQEEIKSRLKSGNALVLFGAEYFVFLFAIQKYEN